MILIHYTNDVDAIVDNFQTAITPGGSDTPGMFFYPEEKEAVWNDRIRLEFYAPDSIVEEIQSFEAGEVAENEVVEVFVSAANLDQVKML